MGIKLIKNVAWNRLIVSADTMKRVLPTTYKNILEETGSVIGLEADRNVHIVTGRTKASGYMTIPSLNQITVVYKWGGYWEEKKGGAHAFLTKGVMKGKAAMPNIIKHYIVPTIQQVLDGKATTTAARVPRYSRKWKDPQTGEWRYEYRQGYMGGHGKRMGGMRTKNFPTT